MKYTLERTGKSHFSWDGDMTWADLIRVLGAKEGDIITSLMGRRTTVTYKVVQNTLVQQPKVVNLPDPPPEKEYEPWKRRKP